MNASFSVDALTSSAAFGFIRPARLRGCEKYWLCLERFLPIRKATNWNGTSNNDTPYWHIWNILCVNVADNLLIFIKLIFDVAFSLPPYLFILCRINSFLDRFNRLNRKEREMIRTLFHSFTSCIDNFRQTTSRMECSIQNWNDFCGAFSIAFISFCMNTNHSLFSVSFDFILLNNEYK